jgi:hypothetical protein
MHHWLVALILAAVLLSGCMPHPPICFGDYSDPAAMRVLADVLTVGEAEIENAFSCGQRHITVNSAEAPDYVQRANLDREKAEKGDPEAQYALGIDYEYGLGVQQDLSQSAKWYRSAADDGYLQAQSSLGEMYAVGHGVPQDYVQADMWCSIAAAGGNDAAAINRDDLEMKMTPAQIAQAKKLASEWKPIGAGSTAPAPAASTTPRQPANRADFGGTCVAASRNSPGMKP